MISLTEEQLEIVQTLRQNPEYVDLTKNYTAAIAAGDFKEFEILGKRLSVIEQQVFQDYEKREEVSSSEAEETVLL